MKRAHSDPPASALPHLPPKRVAHPLREIGAAAWMGMLRLLIWPLYAMSLGAVILTAVMLFTAWQSFVWGVLLLALLTAIGAVVLFKLAGWGRVWYSRLRDAAPPEDTATS